MNQHFNRKLLMKIFRYSDVFSDATARMNPVEEYVAAQIQPIRSSQFAERQR